MATKKTDKPMTEEDYKKKMQDLEKKLTTAKKAADTALEAYETARDKYEKARETYKDKKSNYDEKHNKELEIQNEMLILYMQTHHNSSNVAYYESFLKTIKVQFETGEHAKNLITGDEEEK